MFRHLLGDDCAPHCGAGHGRGAGEPGRDIPNDNNVMSIIIDNDHGDNDIPDGDIHCQVTGSPGQRGWEIRGSSSMMYSIQEVGE